MLYTVASQGWAPGSLLPASETRAGLYRTRREAEAVAAGRRLLAVSVHYDATRGLLTPTPPAGRELSRGWSAPAIEGASGGLTCLASIPCSLVRLVGPARPGSGSMPGTDTPYALPLAGGWCPSRQSEGSRRQRRDPGRHAPPLPR